MIKDWILVNKLPWVWLLLAAAVLPACEYPGVPHRLAAEASAENPSKVVAAPPSSAATSTDGSQSASASVLQGKVPVTQRDFKLVPDTLTVKAGPVTFVLKNEGRFTHDFRVEGQGLDEKAPKVGSGRTMEWKINLKPGTYRISCPVSNHADRGMVGTLTVVP